MSKTMTREEFNNIYKDGSSELSLEEKRLLAPYRVDNAIIMAAGYSARCMPLSNVMPKGLFKIKGEILIEREIRQLIEAGINDIYVITGFKADMFSYLEEKYGVKFIHNADYDKYNNISSLYAAKEYIGRSYILCSDNYYSKNVFREYVYESYYSCVYSKNFCDEFCVTKYDKDGRMVGLHRGGEDAWYTIGDCFFDENYSKTFLDIMCAGWDNIAFRNQLMDDVQVSFINQLPMYVEKRGNDEVLEFDTLEEIRAFDPDFKEFINNNLDQTNEVIKVFTKYSDVDSYHSVPTETLSGRLHLNENLFKPSSSCLSVLKNITMEDLYLYDLYHNDELVDLISTQTGISGNNIFIHNGSAEVIKSIFSILLSESDRVLIPSPGWSYYKSVADAKFAECISYEVSENKDAYAYNIDDILTKAKELKPRIIVITSPHMPTGCSASQEDIEKVICENPDSVVMLDEAYWGFENGDSSFEKRIITKYSNVIITRTFSKFYGLANIRIGYGLSSYPLRRTVGLDLPLFKSSGIDRKIAIAALTDTDYYDNMRKEVVSVREWFYNELLQMKGLTPYKSKSNYVFVKLANADADRVRAYMEENGILIRLFTDKEDLRLRITIGPRDLMERVVYQLKRAIAE